MEPEFVATTLLALGIIGLSVARIFRKQEKSRRILNEGLMCQSTVLSIDRSWTGDSGVRVELTLEVRNGASTREVSVVSEVEPHMLPHVRAGMQLPVRIDPDRPSTVLIDAPGFTPSNWP